MPASCVCASFVSVVLLFHGSPFCARTVAPTPRRVGVFCVRVVGKRGLLWACLLVGGWGLVFARGGVFVFWCLRLWVLACLLGVVGWCGCAAPPFFCSGLFACLLVCVFAFWCGFVGVCDAPFWVWGNGSGAGQCCPAPFGVVVLSGCCVAWGEEGGVGVLLGVVSMILLCSPTWERVSHVGAERGGGWSLVGCASVGLGGGGGGVFTRLVYTIHSPGSRGGGGLV